MGENLGKAGGIAFICVKGLDMRNNKVLCIYARMSGVVQPGCFPGFTDSRASGSDGL